MSVTKITPGKETRPMEALSVPVLPEGKEWRYEPKWDGFRCLAFKSAKQVDLISKSGKPLNRYFPDIVEILAHLKGPQFILDGELVIGNDAGYSFADLQLRLHPAASRVAKLAAEAPATLVLFDLLMDDRGTVLLEKPMAERRERLEKFFNKSQTGEYFILSPQTASLKAANKWLESHKSRIDGIVAKKATDTYQPGERVMQKYKALKTADCVVGGFRYGTNSKYVASLLLGLYDDEGQLNHVGFTSSLKDVDKEALTKKLEKLIAPPGFTGRAPGGPSRWSTERSGDWQPLKPELVVEVKYDHVSDERFRHGTKFLRWRPDKSPRQCTMEQLGK
jgi:ATP-dependent DNA ligase